VNERPVFANDSAAMAPIDFVQPLQAMFCNLAKVVPRCQGHLTYEPSYLQENETWTKSKRLFWLQPSP
jgi:hypothetical protein